VTLTNTSGYFAMFKTRLIGASSLGLLGHPCSLLEPRFPRRGFVTRWPGRYRTAMTVSILAHQLSCFDDGFPGRRDRFP
jgi:hypothetical protein